MRGLRQFALHKWMRSIYKHYIHQTYCQHFEVYASIKYTEGKKQSSPSSDRAADRSLIPPVRANFHLGVVLPVPSSAGTIPQKQES